MDKCRKFMHHVMTTCLFVWLENWNCPSPKAYSLSNNTKRKGFPIAVLMSKLQKSRHCNINQMPSWGLAGLQRTGRVLKAMALRRTNISRETLPWYLQRFNNFIWGLNDQMLQLKLKLYPENTSKQIINVHLANITSQIGTKIKAKVHRIA